MLVASGRPHLVEIAAHLWHIAAVAKHTGLFFWARCGSFTNPIAANSAPKEWLVVPQPEFRPIVS